MSKFGVPRVCPCMLYYTSVALGGAPPTRIGARCGPLLPFSRKLLNLCNSQQLEVCRQGSRSQGPQPKLRPDFLRANKAMATSLWTCRRGQPHYHDDFHDSRYHLRQRSPGPLPSWFLYLGTSSLPRRSAPASKRGAPPELWREPAGSSGACWRKPGATVRPKRLSQNVYHYTYTRSFARA